MKEILVTGAFGFIGRHVAKAASQNGYYVVGLGHGSWGREEWRHWGLSDWRNAEVDVESLITYAGLPDTIIHCAGSGSVAFSVTNPVQDFRRTVDGTLSVLEFIRINSPGTRLVLPSSAGVYGVVEQLPISTGARLNPASPYGVNKKIAEELCKSYSQHFGLRASIVRLFSVYGRGLRKQLLWDACVKLSNENGTFFGTGVETRDWIHVDDAAKLLLTAVDHASSDCPIANGGTGSGVPIRDVLAALSSALGYRGTLEFNGLVRSGDPQHYIADISESLEWGWKPERDLTSELKNYADWFKLERP